MNPQLSKTIFGIGIALSIASIASIYINMLATQNQDQNTQGGSSQQPVSSSDSASTATPETGTGTSISIIIPNGAASQASSLNNDYYKPVTTNISSGSRVTWTNQDIAAHTSTSGQSNNSPDSGQSFNTGTIAPGSTGSAVVTGSGKIPYHCTFHPWMIASLQITGSSQAPSTGSTPADANVGTSLQKVSAIPTINDSRLKVTEVISNLSMPTTVAFLGPNDFLLLQKGGTVSRVTNGTLVTPPLLNVTVGTGITQGMLGVATSNVSKTNSTYVFLYYTEVINMNQTNDLNQDQNQSNASASEPLQNRLYRYELVSGKLVNPKLLAVLPAKEGYMDNGGYLKIGPDNNLYFSVGAVTASDVSDIQTLTQNFVNGTPVDGRAGILRMTQDGDPVLDEEGRGLLGNSSPLNLYYGYGLKDSFGMDFDPITGNLWDAEPGRIINDEINLVKPGFNGGFEAIQGQSVYTPAAPADLVDFNGTGIYRNPEFVWTQKVVPVGLTFLNSNKMGTNYENDLFLGGFLNGNIYHFDLNENRTHLIVPSSFVYKTMATWNSTGASDITFGKGFGDISSLTVGPDGYLYVVSFGSGAIYKIEPT